jgi:hypothetical protein
MIKIKIISCRDSLEKFSVFNLSIIRYCSGLVTVAGFEGRRGERRKQVCGVRWRQGSCAVYHVVLSQFRNQ